MELKNVVTRQIEEVFMITISREEKLNALNHALIDELHYAFSEAGKNASVAGIILTGAGSKAFVAGADIAAFQSMSPQDGENMARYGQEKVFDLIENLGKPVIAAINGFALGGGLELAMACQMRIAAEHSKMGLPEVSLGLIPGYGGTQRLAQLVGKGKAMEMILSGEFITAAEAHQCRLINRVTSAENLLDEAFSMMKKMTKNAPDALQAAIKSINAGIETEGYETEVNLFGKCFGTVNSKEGILAFIEKRKPVFTH